MKLSVVVPAFNEEKYLPETLTAIGAAAAGLDCETIVVDNQSDDKTVEIATSFGAKVVTESERSIAKVRNTGAENARGEVLIFIDADTTVPPELFQKIAEAFESETCFGGAVAVEFGEFARKWMRYYLVGWWFWQKFFNMKQGAAQFCRKDVFEKLGGYDTSIFVGEDIEFYWRLTKFARKNGGHLFFIQKPKVKTSPRRLDKIPFWKTFILMNPIYIFLNWRTQKLWKTWYEKTIR